MPRLIVFGGAPTTDELLSNWEPEFDEHGHIEFQTLPLQARSEAVREEQDSMEASYECSLHDPAPSPEGTSNDKVTIERQQQQQQQQHLKPISSLRRPTINEASCILPPLTLKSASELSIDSFDGPKASNASLLEDSYATTANHTASPSALKIPDYRFNVERILPLADALAHWQRKQNASSRHTSVDVLGFLSAIEPIKTVQIKQKGNASATLLKFELCDESVSSQAVGKLKLSAWDNAAEDLVKAFKKGDIIWLSRACLAPAAHSKMLTIGGQTSISALINMRKPSAVQPHAKPSVRCAIVQICLKRECSNNRPTWQSFSPTWLSLQSTDTGRL